MPRLTFLFILLACLFLSNCHSYYQAPNFDYVRSPHTLRITTYNINWGVDSLPLFSPIPTILAIRNTNADIILLQEVTPDWQNYLEQAFAKTYPYRAYEHYPLSGGKAILSKYPIVNKNFLRPIYGWHPSWQFEIITPFGHVQMVNTHLTPPLASMDGIGFLGYALFITPGKHIKEIKNIYQYLHFPSTTIIAGDFNEGDTGRAVRYLKKKGFTDALSYVDKHIKTWHWKTTFLNLQGRYDHMLFSPDLHLVKVQVYQAGHSDHYPVIADFLISDTRHEGKQLH